MLRCLNFSPYKKLKKPPQKVAFLWQLGVFFLCILDCPKQPRSSFPLCKFFYQTISGRISVHDICLTLCTYMWYMCTVWGSCHPILMKLGLGTINLELILNFEVNNGFFLKTSLCQTVGLYFGGFFCFKNDKEWQFLTKIRLG